MELLKPAVTLSSVSIPVRNRKWIDIETQHMINSVTKCQAQRLDCYDMTHQFLEKMMEQFYLTTLWKNAGRKISMVLRNDQLTIGYLFWQEEEEPRKGFNIA